MAAALAVRADSKQALEQLADALQDILKDVRKRLGQIEAVAPEPKPRARRPKQPRAPRTALREHIIQALKALGGSARVSDVMDQMARQLEGKLLPGDTLWREATNEPAWQNNTKWERLRMTQDGALRVGSPRGVWELGEK